MAIRPSRRLSSSSIKKQLWRKHARRYHAQANKSWVIGKYSQELDRFDNEDVRKHAAHVASWIAYGPKARTPKTAEIELLRKYMAKLRGGLLPERLQVVLPDAKTALQSAFTIGEVSEVWRQAAQKLQRILDKFCCCRPPADPVLAVAANHESAAEDVVVVPDDDEASHEDPASLGASSQHLQLCRRINQWGFLDDVQKLERLRQAEEVARRPWRNLSEVDLAEVVSMAATALAAPRRKASAQDEEAGESGQAAASADPGANHDLQRRVRSLLLRALRMWRTSHYDFGVIEHVLGFVHVKIDKFEEKVGSIQDAAAGRCWQAIKDVIDELQGVARRASGLQACQDKRRHRLFRRLERQSGVQCISWKPDYSRWRVQWLDGGKRKFLNFPISKHMREGLSEDEAVAAALEEAKAHREELVRQGKLKPSKPIACMGKAGGSTVRGVVYRKKHRKWQVQLTDPSTKKPVHGGTFQVRVEAEAKAREMAAKFGIPAELEVVPAKLPSELPCFEPLGPEKGVRWAPGEQSWHAQCTVGWKRRHMRFRPKDLSEKEVEKAWKQALAWRREQLQKEPRKETKQ